MTPFTDEDLKRLKIEGLRLGNIAADDLRGLIARLEAAEKAIFAADDGPEIDAWRKAAGK